MQGRDGPAAVRGDASPPRRHWALGPGKTVGEGAPSQKTCRPPRQTEPLAEGRIRASPIPRSRCGPCGRSRPRAARGRGARPRARRRQDAHDLRRQRPEGRRGDAARRAPGGRAARASSTSTSTSSSFGNYVDQIGFYPGAGDAGWVFKVNGVSPPVGADQVQLEGRRHGRVVLGRLRPERRPADARARSGRRPAATRPPGRTTRACRRCRPGSSTTSTDAPSPRRPGTSASRAHTGPSGQPRRAPSGRTGCRDPRRRRGRRRRAPRRVRERRRPRARDALGDARRGEDGAARAAGARRRDGDAGARARGDDLDPLRRPLRPGDRRRLRLDLVTPRLVLLRERDRGRPRRGRVRAPRRRRRVVGLPRLGPRRRERARRRRCVPRAVPARVRRQGAAGGRDRRLGVGAHARAARCTEPSSRARPAGANVLRLVGGRPRFTARLLASGAVEFTFAGNATRLALVPALYRYRYSVP